VNAVATARLHLLLPMTLAVALVLVLAAVVPLRAVEPKEMLANPMLEARARVLSKELRCMVCQNQSIDDSDAPLARDIRLLIRDRIAKGESNDAVRSFLVSRYGNFILLKPPLMPQTLLLWAGAPLALAAGAFAIWRSARRRQSAAPPLSEAEEARLAAIVEEGERG